MHAPFLRRRGRRVGVLLALTALFLTAVPAPSQALPGGAAAQVSCTAVFPQIPGTVQWTPGGSCNGTAIVAGAGIDSFGAAYVLEGSAPFAAAFSYYEPCFVSGQPAIFISLAVGGFTITNVPAGGRTANVSGNFMWTRVGLNPVIVLSNIFVAFSNGATVTSPGGAGTASFVPPGNFDTSKHLLCGQGGGPLTIPVVIAAAIAL